MNLLEYHEIFRVILLGIVVLSAVSFGALLVFIPCWKVFKDQRYYIKDLRESLMVLEK